MTEEELVEYWAALHPTSDQRRRINRQVSLWLEAHDTSILSEWAGLFRSAPLTAVGLSAASAVAILLATPVFWLARALM